MRRAGAVTLAAVLSVVGACSSTAPTVAPNASSPAETPLPISSPGLSPVPSPALTTPKPTDSPPPSPWIASLPSGGALPECSPAAPAPSDTVTFVANGHAWALNPSGGHLTCLFKVADPGPFSWGPLGDRVLLGGLEVKGVSGGPNHAPSDPAAGVLAWSRPTGASIVFAAAGDSSLQKLRLSGAANQNVTPLPGSRYLSVVYHPSGEAFVAAVEQDGTESIWISSNLGKTPKALVTSEEDTSFGAMGFEADGRHLLYAALHADNHSELHRLDITDLSQAPVMWEGPTGSMIQDIQPGRRAAAFAWTTGASCADAVAMAGSPGGSAPILPGATSPTRAIGWLSETQVLVATGACDRPLDLAAVDVSTGSAVALVSGVVVAAVRTPAPTPAAPLPKPVASLGSGFS